jgi:hypothetical protein
MLMNNYNWWMQGSVLVYALIGIYKKLIKIKLKEIDGVSRRKEREGDRDNQKEGEDLTRFSIWSFHYIIVIVAVMVCACSSLVGYPVEQHLNLSECRIFNSFLNTLH